MKASEICEKPLKADQKRFCSKTCMGKGRTLDNTVLCICKYCGKEFRISKGHFMRSKGEGSFCSVECRGKSMTTKIKKDCLYCGKEFETHPCRIKNALGKYCSKGCVDMDRIGKYAKENNSHWKGGPVPLVCKECGNTFYVIPARINIAKYCSRECNWQSLWREAQKYIDNGYKVILNHGNHILEHRQIVSEIIGRKLLSEEIVHHKNFDKKNNDPSNLALFANRSSHMKYHMTGIITNCVWDLGGENLCYQETFACVS